MFYPGWVRTNIHPFGIPEPKSGVLPITLQGNKKAYQIFDRLFT